MDPQVGSILEGKVASITKFGAFIALEGGKSGLVHISEIANTFVNDVHDFLQEGQEVKVLVLSAEKGRINLSIKKALPPPPRPSGAPMAQGGARPQGRGGFAPRPAAQPAGPASFEDRLKQFMQQSDSKLSEIRAADRRNTRRGNGRGR